MTDDTYEGPFHPVPIGENCLQMDGEGRITLAYRKPNPDVPKAWKGAQRTKALPDSAIRQTGENSHAWYYGIENVTVIRSKKRKGAREWSCGSCSVNRCQHTVRVARWKADHQHGGSV